MTIQISDWGLLQRAEQAGLVSSMTGLVERVRTPLNNELSSYFRESLPKFEWLFEDDEADNNIDAVNAYLQEQGIEKKLYMPYSSGTNIFLIPLTDNLQVKFEATDVYEGNGEYSKFTSVDFFVINESTTTADVDQLITFVKEILG
ncbi:hypothetical protein ABD91_21020 [Lysinibacillus sphaericus]|uniref:hypothetical protein n=1 Tax=Lysinibacillus sphaericus TaxID=1421 RepID=UPI0018CF4861|nr:hypothetical protein [Lysinibacillus sphaericus]MBG9693223.1 hypothetical protein [Lysinibacillus sphaericus]